MKHRRKIDWSGAVPFILCHVAVIGVFFSGFTWTSVIVGLLLWRLRLWAVTAGYHRYFAHRAFRTSRGFQFCLAFLAQTTAQKGVIWWAAHHRFHHRYSDKKEDVHSPVVDSFFYSHVGWIFDKKNYEHLSDVPDLMRFPELRFLDKYYLLPPTLLAIGLYFWLGLPGLFVSFFLSTVVTWHSTFTINSLSHVFGKKRFATSDDSRNNPWLAILTMGEGWHNNHHFFPRSARNGFYWWEWDPTYYSLWLLSKVGIVWDLKPVPEAVYRRADENRVALKQDLESLKAAE